MNNRLKEIRNAKGLSQLEFSKRLGISRGHLAGLESGAKNITERLITDICREFNVNKTWLTDGTGEMFLDPLENIIADDEIRDMVRMYTQLDENTKKIFINFMNSALNEAKK